MENPIERLLDALPAAVAEQMRDNIQTDLKAAGMFEHWRQNMGKPGKDISLMTFRAVAVFVKHTGLSYEFFSAEPEAQEIETLRIVQHHYDALLNTLPAVSA